MKPPRLHIGQYVYDVRDRSVVGVLNSLSVIDGCEFGEIVIRGRSRTENIQTVFLKRKYRVDPSLYLRQLRVKYQRKIRDRQT